GRALFFDLIGRAGAFVVKLDAQALVQKRHLLEPGAQRVVLVLDTLGEDRGVRPERDARSGVRGLLALLKLLLRCAAVGEAMPPDVALLLDLDVETSRERVD